VVASRRRFHSRCNVTVSNGRYGYQTRMYELENVLGHLDEHVWELGRATGYSGAESEAGIEVVNNGDVGLSNSGSDEGVSLYVEPVG